MARVTFSQLLKTSFSLATRSMSTTSPKCAGFFSKGESSGHGSQLARGSSVYELVTDCVVPTKWEVYLANKQTLVQAAANNLDIRAELAASWTFVSGDSAFKALHLYKYKEGWSDIDVTRAAVKEDKEFQAIYREGLPTLAQQSSELSKAFSFWPGPTSRTGANVYDIWSYTLRPGSMYDWSNYWARGLQHRSAVRGDIPFTGLFTQLGNLHTVHHIWCYTSLVDRKNCRGATWNSPQWYDVVANTAPLVKNMTTRIMEPLAFSPTK